MHLYKILFSLLCQLRFVYLVDIGYETGLGELKKYTYARVNHQPPKFLTCWRPL